MKINDELTVKIEDYDHEGRGIAIYDGFPIFIEKALLNETLLVTINYINSSYAKAYINKIVIPSPLEMIMFVRIITNVAAVIFFTWIMKSN